MAVALVLALANSSARASDPECTCYTDDNNFHVSGNFCVSLTAPPPNNRPLCINFGIPGVHTTALRASRWTQRMQGTWSYVDEFNYQDSNGAATANDPYGDVTRRRDRGSQLTSAAGSVPGQSYSSHTTDVGGGVDGHYNLLRTFDLSGYQRLTVGGFFRYDSSNTDYNTSPNGPGLGLLSTGSLHNNDYTLGGLLVLRHNLRRVFLLDRFAQ